MIIGVSCDCICIFNTAVSNACLYGIVKIVNTYRACCSTAYSDSRGGSSNTGSNLSAVVSMNYVLCLIIFIMANTCISQLCFRTAVVGQNAYTDTACSGTHTACNSKAGANQGNIIASMSIDSRTLVITRNIIYFCQSDSIRLCNRYRAGHTCCTIGSSRYSCTNSYRFSFVFALCINSKLIGVKFLLSITAINLCGDIAAQKICIRSCTDANSGIRTHCYRSSTNFTDNIGFILSQHADIARSTGSICFSIINLGISCTIKMINSHSSGNTHCSITACCQAGSNNNVIQLMLCISRNNNAFAVLMLLAYVFAKSCFTGSLQRRIFHYALSIACNLIVGNAHTDTGLTACSHTHCTGIVMQSFTARRQGCHIIIGNNGRMINFCCSIIADQVYRYITSNACILGSRCTDTYRSQLSSRIAFRNKIICFICAAFDFCFSICVDFVYGNAKACCCILGTCTHNTDGSNFRCSFCRCLNIAFCSIIGIYISILQLGLCFFFNQSCRTATAERKITRCNRNTCGNSRQRRFIYGINANLSIVSSGNISIINRCSIALLAAGQCTDIIDCYTAADGCLGTAADSNTHITDNRQLVAVIRGLHCHLAHIIELRASAVIFVNNSFYIITTAVNNNHAIQSVGCTCGNCCADAVHVTLVSCIYSKNATIIAHAADFAALDIRTGSIVQGIVGNCQACAHLRVGTGSNAYLSCNIHCQSTAFGLYISFGRNKLAVFNSCRNIVIQRLPVSTAAYAEAACSSGRKYSIHLSGCFL